MVHTLKWRCPFAAVDRALCATQLDCPYPTMTIWLLKCCQLTKFQHQLIFHAANHSKNTAQTVQTWSSSVISATPPSPQSILDALEPSHNSSNLHQVCSWSLSCFCMILLFFFLLFCGYGDLSREQGSTGVNLITHFHPVQSQEWVQLHLYIPYMPLWHGEGLNLYLYHLNAYLCHHKAPTSSSFPTFLPAAWSFPPPFVIFIRLHLWHLPFIFMLTTLFGILSFYILKPYQHQIIQLFICLSKYESFNFLSSLAPYSPSSGSSSYIS